MEPARVFYFDKGLPEIDVTGQECSKILAFEGAAAWQASNAIQYFDENAEKIYCAILPCSEKSKTLAHFIREKDAFGKVPDKADKYGGVPAYTIQPFDRRELEMLVDAANQMRTLPHAFWGITWMQARAVSLVCANKGILAESLAWMLIEDFAIQEEEFESILNNVVLDLTQICREMSWIEVNGRGRLYPGNLVVRDLQDQDSELEQYLLPWTVLTPNSQGPPLPTVLVEGRHGCRIRQTDLIQYFKHKLQDGKDEVFPHSLGMREMLWSEKTKEIQFPWEWPIETRNKFCSEYVGDAERVGKYGIRCDTNPVDREIVDAMWNEMMATVSLEFLSDDGEVVKFDNPKAYADGWFQYKLESIMDSVNNLHKGTSLLAKAKLFLGQLYFNRMVDENLYDGSTAMESVTKRFFIDDESVEEKLASIRLDYPKEMAPILANLPICMLSENNATPPACLEQSTSVRDVYLKQLSEM